MADRALRGMTIGAKSMESEDGVEFAERMIVSYECPMAHVTRIPMSTEAEVPPTWECPECGQPAARRGEEDPAHPLGHAPGAPQGRGARGSPQRAP